MRKVCYRASMFIPLLLLALLPEPNRTSGTALYKSCLADIRTEDDPKASDTDVIIAATCINYVEGFIDSGIINRRYCMNGVSLGTATRVYVAFLREHPKLMDMHKGAGLDAALRSAYGCRR